MEPTLNFPGISAYSKNTDMPFKTQKALNVS
jgi:hypothetical protein